MKGISGLKEWRLVSVGKTVFTQGLVVVLFVRRQFLLIALLVLNYLLSSVAIAQSPYSREELSLLWQTEGEQILKQLGIKNYQLLFDGEYFEAPQMTWVFQESNGFNQLLRALEKQTQPFSQIEVLPGQFLLFNSVNKQHKSIVLWIKRQQEEEYSGALSFMQSTAADSSNQSYQVPRQKTSLPSKLSPLVWIPSHSTVLLDVENYPDRARQWIYVLPFSMGEAKQFMEQQLRQHQWRVQPQRSPGMMVWQKNQEQLLYHLVDIDGNTSLFVMKKHLHQ